MRWTDARICTQQAELAYSTGTASTVNAKYHVHMQRLEVEQRSKSTQLVYRAQVLLVLGMQKHQIHVQKFAVELHVRHTSRARIFMFPHALLKHAKTCNIEMGCVVNIHKQMQESANKCNKCKKCQTMQPMPQSTTKCKQSANNAKLRWGLG